MWLIFLGPPGSGKGTQAKRVASHFQIPHISTGDMLREAVSMETEAGLKAKSFMDNGQLVPDEIINSILCDRMDKDDCRNGFLLDGFPRNRAQCDVLSGKLNSLGIKLTAVIEISVPFDGLVKRICGRRNCPECGISYHVLYSPPEKDNLCDRCGSNLIIRPDDTESVIRTRYDEYLEKTSPVSLYYKDANLLYSLNGELNIEEVYKNILSIVSGL